MPLVVTQKLWPQLRVYIVGIHRVAHWQALLRLYTTLVYSIVLDKLHLTLVASDYVDMADLHDTCSE